MIARGDPRRAFEYLAATSASFTTRKPGRTSFTAALIWSLSHLAAEQGGFSTLELVRSIQNDAPDFPQDQCPRLSERRPSCHRKIILAPLIQESQGRQRLVTYNDEEDSKYDN